MRKFIDIISAALFEARRGLSSIGELRAKVFWNPRHADLIRMLDASKIGDLRGSWVKTADETLTAIWPARNLGHWNFHNECFMREGIVAKEKIDFRVGREYSVLQDERYWSKAPHYKGEGFYCSFFSENGRDPLSVPEISALFGPLTPMNTITEGSAALGDYISAKVGMEDADFWIIRRGGEKSVGEPVKEYAPERIGIKIIATDTLDPQYLFYMIQHLWMRGYFKERATGSTKLVNIKVSDVTGISLG